MITYKEQLQTMIDAYFPVKYKKSYENNREELKNWMRFVDLLCMLCIYVQENKTEMSFGKISSSAAVNTAIKALEPYNEETFPCAEELKKLFYYLIYRGKLSAEEGNELFLSRLMKVGKLKEAEVAALYIAAAMDYDVKYATVFEALSGKRKSRPTIGVICQLLTQFLGSYEEISTILLDENRYFRRVLCVKQPETEGETGAHTPLKINQLILQALHGNGSRMKLSSDVVTEYVDCEETYLNAHQEQIEKVVKSCQYAIGGTGNYLFNLVGPEGIGKKFVAKMAAKQMGYSLLVLPMDRIIGMGEYECGKLLNDIILKCTYEQSILYMDLSLLNLEEDSARVKNRLAASIRFLESYISLFMIGSVRVLPTDLKYKGIYYSMEMKAPGAKMQEAFWKSFCEEFQIHFAEDVEYSGLVSKYELTPKKIRQVLQCVKIGKEQNKGIYIVTKEELEKQIRANSGAEFGIYATRIDSHYTLQDIGLTELSKKKFTEACNRVKYRSVVNETYGFQEKLSYGKGVAIVFYGPPGTGKTMAAQVMANELGLDIYRIDLSQIMNKYIGETQKNIGKLFDAARNTNAILFFDEADALFGKRTEVSSSNDKHANSETAFLLQKIEEYSGVSILATNAVNNMDSAFKRRMAYMIEIGQPDEETRLKIWKNIFSEKAPFAEEIRFEAFAAVADQLTGSGIKSAALSASYFAASEGRSIANQDIIIAIDNEYTKTGRLSILEKLYAAMYSYPTV